MSLHTRSQQLAQAAFERVSNRTLNDKYKTAAKKFPSLIHTCGLAQAVAFTRAKSDYHGYLDDLASVLKAMKYSIESGADLDEKSRKTELGEYLRLSRDEINAASWLKRYVEAVAPDTTEDKE